MILLVVFLALAATAVVCTIAGEQGDDRPYLDEYAEQRDALRRAVDRSRP